MANQLKMATAESILSLHEQGWPGRRIAQELGIDRETVAKYIRATTCVPKPAKAPLGSEILKEEQQGGGKSDFTTALFHEDEKIECSRSSPLLGETGDISKPAKVPLGSDSKPAKAPLGSEAVSEGHDPPETVGGVQVPLSLEKGYDRSACEPYRKVILEKLELGLTAQRIYQDLVAEGFKQQYHSVRRFVAKLRKTSPLPFRRMESEAGEEAQVDFGTGAWIDLPGGKRRRPYVFRFVLSYSRKGYSEATFRQTTEDFIRCLENAFWHLGGVPKVVVIDNLKAAVKHPDWYDPELNPKLQSFGRHYGTVILPTKPRTPRHKGKVEAGVDYVQENGLKGHRFGSLEQENEHLFHWEASVADTRIHGTIRKQVGKLFNEVERAALLPLPAERFPFFHEGERIVHRDGHVEVAKAYYSVPPEYLGHTLWVRWDMRLVHIFNHRMEPIAVHLRKEPGRFSTHDSHIASEKRSGVERGAEYLLRQVRTIGEQSVRWAENMLKTRGIEGVRVLQGLLTLRNQHEAEAIERACQLAFSHGEYRLRTVRKLLKRSTPEQETFDFLDEHPIIRPLGDYEKLVSTSFQRPWTPGSTSVVYCHPTHSSNQESFP